MTALCRGVRHQHHSNHNHNHNNTHNINNTNNNNNSNDNNTSINSARGHTKLASLVLHYCFFSASLSSSAPCLSVGEAVSVFRRVTLLGGSST